MTQWSALISSTLPVTRYVVCMARASFSCTASYTSRAVASTASSPPAAGSAASSAVSAPAAGSVSASVSVPPQAASDTLSAAASSSIHTRFIRNSPFLHPIFHRMHNFW